jgi:eight-cysteine-cluster-containing protein
MSCSELPRQASVQGAALPGASSSAWGALSARWQVGRLSVLGVLCGALIAGSGCKKAEPTPDAPPVSPPPAAAQEPAEVPTADAGSPPSAKTGASTAAELYGSCRERVERPEADGECSSDADCVASGCSQELCTSTAAAAEGLMSTCEMRPCFKVLDACGCVEGHCRWSLKELAPGDAGLPGMGIPIPLPVGDVPPVNQDAQQ